MRILLPEKVKFIINKLEENGFEAFAVGGCVRDSALGRRPADWDITTSAKPREVKEVFSHTIDTGIIHGTVTVMLEREGFEVTTYRIDGEYTDARHPSGVTFTGNLLEDLRRRDFTINAMAYNERAGLVDAFDGMGDMERGLIRCVGSAGERFGEDALRMLRAVRFSAQLGFELEEETRAAIEALAPQLARISAERIQVELIKLLVSPHPEEVRTLRDTGISRVLFPWLDDMFETPQNNRHHCYTVGEHTVCTLKAVPADKVLRLAMLLHDVAKPCCRTTDEKGEDHFKGHPREGAAMARHILKGLKLDNDTIDRVCSLILWHDDNPPATPRGVRLAMNRAGLRQFPGLFLVKRADAQGKNPVYLQEFLAYVDEYECLYREILKENQCISLKGLAVTGKDLLAAGVEPGRAVGEALQVLLEQVLEHPEYNKKEILLEMLSHRA